MLAKKILKTLDVKTWDGKPVTQPGIYQGIPNETYHRDALAAGLGLCVSSSQIRTLTTSTPARFKWGLENPAEHSSVFDIGTAAHTLVLRDGADLVEIDAQDWRSKAAREARDLAYKDGKTPLLAAQAVQVKEMADTLRGSEMVSGLLDGGVPELSVFLPYGPEIPLWLRARPDLLNIYGGQPLVIDYKTTSEASETGFMKSVANYGYHQQAAWYLSVLDSVGFPDAQFIFIAQEKTPPYQFGIYQLSERDLALGEEQNQEALNLLIGCQASGNWPGYPEQIKTLYLPTWLHPTDDSEALEAEVVE